jgi:hypothetical protein
MKGNLKLTTLGGGSQKPAAGSIYYATDACFYNRGFLVEMMYTGSIYKNQIAHSAQGSA